MTKWRTFTAGALTALVCLWGTAALASPKPGDNPKLDHKLNDRLRDGNTGTSRVIVMLKPGADASADYRKLGALKGRHFNVINGEVVSLPTPLLRKLADSPAVESIHWDRPAAGTLNRAAVAVGARAVQWQMGLDGAGVGVAIIDSGVTGWHDDLTYRGSNPAVKVVNNQRVSKFIDFVNGRTLPYDDYGHGTHVAGIIAGNGYDSFGARAGIAPAADLVSLKVLDGNGNGYISNVIAALDWIAQNHAAYNIRVVNVSIGAAVTDSAWSDPLDLAAKEVVDAGVVVVAAAGNIGTNPKTGQIQYGGITAPGNAPWVLTVGADSDQGTVTRTDDVMANYSSRGPTAYDYSAKPDIVAPGTGIVSLSAPGSLFYLTDTQFLLGGLQNVLSGTLSGLTADSSSKPYLSLTGTSMASPMVAGTVALMMQANPKLTPNLAKAIIEYTAQDYGYGALAQGAGFLNTQGAVQLASYLAAPGAGSKYPNSPYWSKTILWGNHKMTNGVIKPAGSAYALNVVWGSSRDAEGDNIVWGTQCPTSACDSVVWGNDSVLDALNIVWGTSDGEGDNIVWGTSLEGDNIVWGTSLEGDNIVWGTNCAGQDCLNIVWGTSAGDGEGDNIVWGTNCSSDECDNIVWGTSGESDNIVWGTSSSEGDNIVWGTSTVSPDGTVIVDDSGDYSNVDFDSLFAPSSTGTTDSTTTSTSDATPPPATTDSTTTSGDTTTALTSTLTSTTTAVLGGGL